MNEYSTFLLPKGEVMMTARVENNEIKLLNKTLFPSGKRYDISHNGLVVCLDDEKRLIIYGWIDEYGDIENMKILPFPGGINLNSIQIIKTNLILGGNDSNWLELFEETISHEILLSYSILEDRFTPIEVPIKHHGKSINDLLSFGNRVIAMNNQINPDYLLEYDFSNPAYPYLLKSYKLPEDQDYDSKIKGAMNEKYFALITNTIEGSGGKHINIFLKGHYNEFIRLSWSYNCYCIDDTINSNYWYDIYFPKGKDLLLISAYDGGVGIYQIDNKLMDSTGFEDTKSIIYYNRWGKDVRKIIPVPNDKDRFIIIFQEGDEDNISYTYEIEHMDTIVYILLFHYQGFLPETEDVQDLYQDDDYEDEDSEYFDEIFESDNLMSDDEGCGEGYSCGNCPNPGCPSHPLN